ncbi:MAG TPA: hypothetical protein VK922_01200 [Gemmatimonadaceae bacterium]|nr:hypothetical protein [Gemmatimonadaceae bacterium]
MIRACSRLACAALVVAIASAIAPTAHAQRNHDYDPKLLDHIADGRFDAIPQSQGALTQLLVAYLAFDKQPCSLTNKDAELQSDIGGHFRLSTELMRSYNGIVLTAGFTQLVHPTTAQVSLWVDTHGCEHPRTQSLIRNMFRLSATRSTPAHWGLLTDRAPSPDEAGRGSATVRSAPAPRQAPRASRRRAPSESSSPPTITRRPNAAPNAIVEVPREEQTAWIDSCTSGAISAAIPGDLRKQWCACSSRGLKAMTPQQRQDVLRNYERMLPSLRESAPLAAALFERCTAGVTGRAR